jgi:peptide alpha-N-acetyltransferase
MHGLNIRQARVEDLQGMQSANLHNLPENYDMKYYLYHLMSWPQGSYVATVPTSDGGERVVGYVLSKMQDDVKDEKDDSPATAHITSVSVMRTYRKLGIASKLMKQSRMSQDALIVDGSAASPWKRTAEISAFD